MRLWRADPKRRRPFIRRFLLAATAALIVVPAVSAHAPGCRSLGCDRHAAQHYQHRTQRLGRPALASFYGPTDQGGTLACAGVRGIPSNLTDSTLGVAHKTLPCGHWLTVCARRCAHVQVIDRGPYVPGRDYDLTIGTAYRIGFPLSAGIALIRVRGG